MKTILRNARILKMTDSNIIRGDIVIEDNHIKYIGSDSKQFAPFDIDRDCKGNIIMPGFKNAHTHSAMTFLRSKADDQVLQDWLFKTVLPREELLTEHDVYALNKIAFLEYLTSGITACFDQYYFPLFTKKAAEEMGMRLVILGTYNAQYNKEGLIKLYHEINDNDGLVKYCFGIHAEYTCPDNELATMVEIVNEEKAPFFTHISETAKEVEECIEKRGKTPVKFLIDSGAYNYGGGGYHCCYFNDEDIKLWKEKNLIVVTCPGSNTKLASGIAPITKYLENGIDVAIGTDGPASNNCLDMFKEMTLLFSLQKVSLKDPTVLDAFSILKMATVNGAKAMGLNDADVLEVGKKADLIEIDLSRPNMQPLNDIISNIVYSGSKDNIKMTMIDGKILYEDGKFNIQESIQDIYNECQKITDRIDNQIKQA